MITNFFRPFFSGIFLETELKTSSRMFEFIYKMFGEGYAAIPKAGIEAIPKQLVNNLKQTSFKFNTKVATIKEREIVLEDGEVLESNFTIVATEASNLIPHLKNQSTKWKSCNTLYFETESRIISKKLIGLMSKSGTLINNIFYHTSLDTVTKPTKELLSVTIIDNQNLPNDLLIKEVERELKECFGIDDSCKFIKQYNITMALPDLNTLQYEMFPSETSLTSSIFLAGDTHLNGSLNAAMISGERAALGVIEKLLGNNN
jgi:protoporphyrinogen oxidase